MHEKDFDTLSRIGGAAPGGSAKPEQERDALDRAHGQPPQDPPAAGTGEARRDTPEAPGNGSERNPERDPAAGRTA